MLWFKQTKSSFQLLKRENSTENWAAEDLEEVVMFLILILTAPEQQCHTQSTLFNAWLLNTSFFWQALSIFAFNSDAGFNISISKEIKHFNSSDFSRKTGKDDTE